VCVCVFSMIWPSRWQPRTSWCRTGGFCRSAAVAGTYICVDISGGDVVVVIIVLVLALVLVLVLCRIARFL
jgi:hypothetical protein